jgi:class 3 adenylate cyclase
MGRRDLPSGTITFLFTDVEGSTRLLNELGPAGYADALERHRTILRQAIAAHAGVEVDTEGDAIFAAFATASGGVSAALEAQAGLVEGPVRVRMGLHTGTPLRTSEGYVGVDVHRAARIAAAGHGGQVLISATTAALIDGLDVPLTDLGIHRLKDLEAGERIHQLGTGTHPPLRTLSPSNLPEMPGRFIGRDAELLEIGELLRDRRIRVLTLVGSGGIGKTRLALEAADGVAGSFPDGRWWVPLASRSDAAEAVAAIGQVLGLADGVSATDIGEHLATRGALVILDNVEHLLPDLAEKVARMPCSCSRTSAGTPPRPLASVTPSSPRFCSARARLPKQPPMRRSSHTSSP